MNSLSRSTYNAILVGVLLVGLMLRVWHIGWALPDIYEEATPFFKGWGMWNWGESGLDGNPHFFNYPALTFLFQWAGQGLHFLAGWILGWYPDLDGFRAAFEKDPTAGIVVGRSLNVLFDLGTVLFVALIARHLIGGVSSLLAGTLAAVNPLQIELAQQINVDVPMTFFVVVSLMCLVRILESGARRWYVAAGLSIGLATACKYTAALLLIVLLVVHFFRVYPQRGLLRSFVDLRLVLAAGLSEVTFFLVNPFILLDPGAFRRGFDFELHHMTSGHFGLSEGSSSSWFYLSSVLPTSVGWGGVFVLLVGIVVIVRALDARWLPVAAYIIAFLAVLFFWTTRAPRYFLPVLPGILILVAAGTTRLWEIVDRVAGGVAKGVAGLVVRSTVIGLIAVAIVGESAAGTFHYHRLAGAVDTRGIAREWIRNRFPGEAFIVMAPVGISVSPPRQLFLLPFVSVGFHRFAPFYDARWYVDFDLVTGSDFDKMRYRAEPERFREFEQLFYDSLDARWTLAGGIAPGDNGRGPTIWFYVPPSGGTPDRFEESLLHRLDSMPSPRALLNFGWNLAAVLEAKRKNQKAAQVWYHTANVLLRRDDPLTTLEVCSGFPVEMQTSARLSELVEALRMKAVRDGRM